MPLSFPISLSETYVRLVAELVLSTLIEKLVFEPGSHPITWAMPGISRPTVPELGDEHTQMPMKVSLYEP